MDGKTVKQVLKNINQEFYLPGIQRTYEWDEEEIEVLFDSLLRGLPIGEINLWTLEDDQDDYHDQHYYQFIENHITDGLNPFTVDELDGTFDDVFPGDAEDRPPHPDSSNPRMTHVNEEIDGQPDRPTISLVIDGQQRLTSLYIGLFGSLIDYRHGTHRKKSENWGTKYLYMNLAKDPSEEDDRQMKYEFEFKWADDSLRVSEDEYWFRVCDLVYRSGDGQDSIPYENYSNAENFVEGHVANEYRDELDDELKSRIIKNLNALTETLTDAEKGYDIDSIFHQMNGGSRNRVKRAFFRLNDRGTSVSPEHKLLSHAIINWAYQSETKEAEDTTVFNPREEIYDLISQFNSRYSDDTGVEYFELDLETVFQYLSALSRETPDADHNLNEDEMDKMKRCWNGEGGHAEFKNTLFGVYDNLKEIGITEKTGLSGTNAIAPILYFAHHNDVDLQTIENKDRIRRYLLAATIGDVKSSKGGWVEPALDELERQTAEESLNHFPYDDIAKAVNRDGHSNRLEPVRDELVVHLDAMTYGTDRVRFVLSHLRDRFTADPSSQVDHIFPQSLFNDETYNELGLSDEERDAYDELKDSIWNLELLRESVHSIKTQWYDGRDADQDSVEQWISRTEEDELTEVDTQAYLHEHDIPADNRLCRFDNFLNFVMERRELMTSELLNEFGFESDDIDKTVKEFDLEELTK